MRFLPTRLAGAFVIELDPHRDERGFFARTFCVQEFEAHGLLGRVTQCSISVTQRRGTVRGLHYQRPPAGEVKLVRCIRGAIHDVIVDLRKDSPTYLKHLAMELSAENRRALYIPEMFAHGFQTLADDAEVLYQMSATYVPELATGVRCDDPALAIQWPLPVSLISDKDRTWPLLSR
jgi:dTDP-4-dehydrorhamnose 3,5-epimerase